MKVVLAGLLAGGFLTSTAAETFERRENGFSKFARDITGPLLTYEVLTAFRQIGWLVVIWVASVATLGVFAGLFRLLMSAAGLTS
jgi:hypothetical protein